LEKAFTLAPDLAEAHKIRGFLLWMPVNRFPHEHFLRSLLKKFLSKLKQFANNNRLNQ